MAQAIGIVGAVLGIVSFMETHFAVSRAQSSSVRIAVGLNSDLAEGSTLSGDSPDIMLANSHGERIGYNFAAAPIREGSFVDIYVDQHNTQQAPYALFRGREGVCIAYITLKWPDEQKYAWVGNWGKDCGVKWYVSG